MAVIIIPRRWTQQPKGGVELRSEYTVRCSYYIDFRHRVHVVPWASGVYFSAKSIPSEGYSPIRDNSIGTYVPEGDSYIEIIKPADEQSDITALFIDYIHYRPSYGYNYFWGNKASWDPIWTPYHPDAYCPLVYDGVASGQVGTSPVVGQYCKTIRLDRKSGVYRQEIDAVPTGYSFNSAVSSGGTTESLLRPFVAGNTPPIKLAFFIKWTRALAREEINAIQQAPYGELFRPYTQRIYFDFTGAGALTISPSSITTSEAFGAWNVERGLTLSAIEGAESFGTSRIDFNCVASGISTAEAFGSETVSLETAQSIELTTGLASLEQFGTPRIDLNLSVTGLTTAEAFGSATVNLDAGQSITVTAIGSAEGFGTAGLVQSGVIATAAIASAEEFGTGRLDFRLVLSDAASSEAFGTTQVALDISQTLTAVGSIATAEAFGTGQLDFSLFLTGLASAGAFGSFVVQGGVQDAFGDPFEGSSLSATDRRIGYPTLVPGKGHIG